MKILLVGGNGFLGRSLSTSLKAFGHEVFSAGRDSANNYQMDQMASRVELVYLASISAIAKQASMQRWMGGA